MSNIGLSLALAISLAGTFPSGNTMPDILAIFQRAVANQGDPARLQHVFQKAAQGKPITVVVIGGSITQGAHAQKVEYQWGSQMHNWWKTTFPKSTVSYHNAGIGATGSLIGVHRLSDHVLKHKPDLVAIEFSVNDGDSQLSSETYEGIVRQILSQPQQPAIVLLNMMSQSGGNVQHRHAPVAKHYNIPMISYRDALFPEIKAKNIAWSDISPDSIHPNHIGHTYAAALVNLFLKLSFDEFTRVGSVPKPIGEIPKPLYGTLYDKAWVINPANAKILENKGFTEVHDRVWKMGLQAQNPGDRIVFEVEATSIALVYRRSNAPAGRARITVDGEVVNTAEGFFDQTWWFTPADPILNNKPGVHKIEVEILPDKHPQSKGNQFQICMILAAGD